MENTIDNLKHYTRGRDDNVINDDTTALKEGNRLLESIKKSRLPSKKQTFERILDTCTGVLNTTMHMTERYPEMWEMKENVKLLNEKLEDLEKYLGKIGETTRKVSI